MLKRLFDVTISCVLLTVLAPILALVALCVQIKLGSPVIFAQWRPGLHAKPFRMYKFRTMSNATDSDGVQLPDAQRLSGFGRLLRATSIDELPELWNVVRGDMSLVGPRPLLTEYLPLYSPEQARRHSVTPGITGLAQIGGRNGIGWDERLKLDVYYVENQSFLLDLQIIVRTIRTVILREGISEQGHATMSKFEGNG